jgi:hypothetical protein
MAEPIDPEALRTAIADVQPVGPGQQNVALAFDRLVEGWDAREHHQAFVYEATQANELLFAGRLYQAVLARWPEEEHALAAQKQISTSAMFAGGLGNKTGAGAGSKLPRWVFLSTGISLVWLIVDLSTEGTFSVMDLGFVVVGLGSIGYAIWRVRS